MSVFETHMKAIESGKLEKTNIIGIRKALNANLRRLQSWSTGCTSPNITDSQVMQLHDTIMCVKPIAIGEMHDSGVKQLQSKRYKNRWTDRQAAIIADIDRFQVLFFTELNNHYYPVFLCTGKNGESFTFYNIPWQSGGNGPEIFEGY